MCGPCAIGCEHVLAGSKPEVILAGDDNKVTHAMCRECADWFNETGCLLELEDMGTTGRVGILCLHCLKLPETMLGPGFWFLNDDIETYRALVTN